MIIYRFYIIVRIKKFKDNHTFTEKQWTLFWNQRFQIFLKLILEKFLENLLILIGLSSRLTSRRGVTGVCGYSY